jgi:hypothetical protein
MIRTVNRVIQEMNEQTTTSADIAYLPSGFTSIETMFRKLAKEKPVWDMEVLDEPEHYKLKVGDRLHITVPKKHVNTFKQESGIDDFGMKEINLSKYVAEAREVDIGGLLNDVEELLYSLLAKPPMLTVDEDLAAWNKAFPGMYLRVKSAALNTNSLEADIVSLIKLLQLKMHDDVGSLQLVLESLKRQTSLAKFDVFEDFSYLLAGVMKSTYKGTDLIFEGLVDMSFGMSEKIYTTNSVVLDAMEEIKLVKVRKNVIYPVGNRFQYNFFISIKNAIEGQ